MNTTTLLKFKAFSFRKMPTPYDSTEKRMYTAVVSVKDIPAELEEWRELNVRDPKESKAVPKDIRESLINDPDNFLFKNRGLLILAQRVMYDNQSQTIELEFADKAMSGLADGGHTNRVIRRHIDGLSKEELDDFGAYVKVEFLEGFKTREDVVPIIEARNNSTPVPEQSFQELLGAYNAIKDQLKGRPYADRIFYKSYEEPVNGVAKDIDVKELLSYLLCFDVETYAGDNHPVKAYSSSAAAVEHFAFSEKDPSKKERLDRFVPLLPTILELRDTIYDALPDAYNEETGGKFGGIRGVIRISKRMKEEELSFIGKTSDYRIPSGFIYPVLGAFRALVEVKDGTARWKQNPIKLFNKLKGEIAARVGGQAIRIGNPNQLGKDKGTWVLCYDKVENEVLKEMSKE